MKRARPKVGRRPVVLQGRQRCRHVPELHSPPQVSDTLPRKAHDLRHVAVERPCVARRDNQVHRDRVAVHRTVASEEECAIGEDDGFERSIDRDDGGVEQKMPAQSHRVWDAAPLVLVGEREAGHAVDLRHRHADEEVCFMEQAGRQRQPVPTTADVERDVFGRLLAQVADADAELLRQPIHSMPGEGLRCLPDAVPAIGLDNPHVPGPFEDTFHARADDVWRCGDAGFVIRIGEVRFDGDARRARDARQNARFIERGLHRALKIDATLDAKDPALFQLNPRHAPQKRHPRIHDSETARVDSARASRRSVPPATAVVRCRGPVPAGASMRILLCSDGFLPARSFGGIAYSSFHLSKALLKAGAAVKVVTTDRNGSDRLQIATDCWNEYDGLPVWYARTLAGPFLVAPSLRRVLRNELPTVDCVINSGTLWTYTGLLGWRNARRFVKPSVTYVRGLLYPRALQFKPRRKRIAWYLWGRRVLRDSSVIVALNESERQDILRMGVKTRIDVIP